MEQVNKSGHKLSGAVIPLLSLTRGHVTTRVRQVGGQMAPEISQLAGKKMMFYRKLRGLKLDK